MARKAGERFRSDEVRLKVRPHVKVHLTARSHRRTAKIFADPEKRGILLGLWLAAGEAFAGKTADTVTLTRADLTFITGRRLLDPGRTSLQGVCDLIGYSLQPDGDLTVITVRNFAKKQGWHPAKRGVTPRTPPPSESDSDTDTEKKSARAESRGRKRPPRTPDLFTRESVEALEPAYFEQLIADRPDLAEAVRTAAHARAWLLAVVPRMDAAGRYTDLRRTARSWFQNARQAEIVEAFDRLAKIAIRTAAAAAPPKPAADPSAPIPAMFNVKLAGQGAPRIVGVT